jgi:citrate synthase
MEATSALERIQVLSSHLLGPQTQEIDRCDTAGTGEKEKENQKERKDTLTITDNRSGKSVELKVKNDTINASELKKVLSAEGTPLMSYDPAYLNTAVASSRISFIDGDRGILEYRGYPIEQLAEQSTFTEVAYLLIHGELPSKDQLEAWNTRIMTHTYIHENLMEMMKTFRYDAHPMGMLISCVAALSTFYPEANAALRGTDIYKSARIRNKQIYRLIGKLPTIAACAYRHRIGRPYNQPRSNLSYAENFLYMLDSLNDTNYRPHPRLARALDIMFILHAEHEMNCSTAAMRHITSSLADPYVSVAGAAAALFGPLHGGANEAVLRMLESIGNVSNVAQFIEEVKAKRKLLFGFGHRVYHNYDPRAKIIRRTAYEVFDIMGKEPLVEVAIALEKAALSDDYFISRKLYPNVDFYSGLIYKAMGFPTDMFPVLFCIPRAVGWLAHWLEQLDDPENKIARPRQVYTGHARREYVPLDGRGGDNLKKLDMYSSSFGSTAFNKRRGVSAPLF